MSHRFNLSLRLLPRGLKYLTHHYIMSIALRRHHSERILRKAKLIAKLQGKFGSLLLSASPESPEKIANRARRMRDHRCACSCQMCRNPRHSSLTKGKDRMTLQERREFLKSKF